MEMLDKMDEMDKKLRLSNEIQSNITAEADAIEKYNFLLAVIDESDLPSAKKEVLQSRVYEIVGDELNHQTVLKELYTLVTGIKENKE